MNSHAFSAWIDSVYAASNTIKEAATCCNAPNSSTIGKRYWMSGAGRVTLPNTWLRRKQCIVVGVEQDPQTGGDCQARVCAGPRGEPRNGGTSQNSRQIHSHLFRRRHRAREKRHLNCCSRPPSCSRLAEGSSFQPPISCISRTACECYSADFEYRDAGLLDRTHVHFYTKQNALPPAGRGRLSRSQDRFHYRSHGSGVIAKPCVARSCQSLSEPLRLSIHRRSCTPLTALGCKFKDWPVHRRPFSSEVRESTRQREPAQSIRRRQHVPEVAVQRAEAVPAACAASCIRWHSDPETR